jgi:hypothetical protein
MTRIAANEAWLGLTVRRYRGKRLLQIVIVG